MIILKENKSGESAALKKDNYEMDRVKVVGIFTCFNRREKTKDCLKRLMELNNDIVFQFIAIDDKSSDGTYEMLKTFGNIIILNGSGNLYYSGGMRLGIEYVKTNYKHEEFDYCLLFNDDVEFYGKSISRLRKFAESTNDVVVGCTCDGEGALSYGGERKKSHFRPTYEKVMSGAHREYCDTFDANCVLIPFGLFKKVENIDLHFVHAMGDFDYGFNCARAGGNIVASDFFVGRCDDNPINGTWRDRTLPLSKRIRLKEGPKGLNTQQWFYFVKKYYGIISAIYSTVISWIRVFL